MALELREGHHGRVRDPFPNSSLSVSAYRVDEKGKGNSSIEGRELVGGASRGKDWETASPNSELGLDQERSVI